MDILFNEKLERLGAAVARLLRAEPGFFAIAVHDLHTNQLWQFQSQPMRSASLIKLFIMAEAFAQIDAGQLSPSDRLAFAESDRVGGAGLLQELPAGTSRTVLDLIELMITESDNIATNLLIDRLGMEKINARIRALDCQDSILRRKMMDFAAAAAGQENLTSVMDVATVLAALHRGLCLDSTSDRQMCDILERQTDRCKIPLLLPTGVVCKHKTGELPGAEHDAGIILAADSAYVLAIMSDNLQDSARGCQTIAQISRTVYEVLTTNQ
jgi:beta-lactamase class A